MTLEEKKEEVTNRVKKKLKENNIQYNFIATTHNPNGSLKDGTPKEILSTTILTPFLNNIIHIRSDVETLELLYVQTGPVQFMEIEDYFQKRD